MKTSWKLAVLVLATQLVALSNAQAQQGEPPQRQAPVNEMHPAFYLRDSTGAVILPTVGEADDLSAQELQDPAPAPDPDPVPVPAPAPVSIPIVQIDQNKTCADCHDTAFINSTSSHHAKHVQVDCLTCHLPGGVEAVQNHAFDSNGKILLPMSAPSSFSCGSCHGITHDLQTPLEILPDLMLGEMPGIYAQTLRTGEIYAGQFMSSSLLNLEGKFTHDRPWDVHAARGLQCSDCHYSANHPQKATWIKKGPVHLKEDPRSLSISAYLKRPDHELKAATCEKCHDPLKVHKSMPYVERHTQALACQACHSPKLYAPALKAVDRTVITQDGGPVMQFRGIEHAEYKAPNTWYSVGYQPILGRKHTDDGVRFAPYNPVATWEWVSSEDGTPVDAQLVRQVFIGEDGKYRPDIIKLLDKDADGLISEGELALSKEAQLVIQEKLSALGVKSPQIRGVVEAHPVSHGIVKGDFTAASCESCHSQDSRFNSPISLGTITGPQGVELSVAPDSELALSGRVIEVNDQEVVLAGSVDSTGTYVLGHHRYEWTDQLGFLIFLASILGVAVHGGLRIIKRQPHAEKPMRRVYLYGIYERIWHWTMAASIIALLITGIQIHFPGSGSGQRFNILVLVHNVAAVIMILNAALSLFFHITTGEIRQFVPRPKGFVRRITAQAMYYLRGIFTGAAHPLAKSAKHKLNPLQQVTYVGLLNVLFPLQVLTGALLWIGGVAPQVLEPIGGLSIIGPVHNVGSWLFLTFIVVHVYLTTTGHTPGALIKAMVSGWEMLEEEAE